jgi:hypothetical protein
MKAAAAPAGAAAAVRGRSIWGTWTLYPRPARTSYNSATLTLVMPAYRAGPCFGQDFLVTTLIHGNRRGAPSRIRVGSLSSIPAMARVSRHRAGVPIIAGYYYIRRVRFSRSARVPNVVAHHSCHVGVFRSLCRSSGLCVGSFYAASGCLSSRSIRPSAACGPLILAPISFVC